MPAPDRPLVSFVLFAYNQERFIREAVKGAFAQSYSPLEIILSDDCSTDRTFEIMADMASDYRGPHTVVLNRNQQNLGLGRHYSAVMGLASGDIVELAAGDDISLPWRTADSVSILNDHPDLTCVSLDIQHFSDDPGLVPVTQNETTDLVKWTLQDYVRRHSFSINAPARAFRKFTHDCFGPLVPQCPVEDGPNLLRCLLHGAAASCGKVGVLYRWNGENMSSPVNIRKIPFSAIYSEYLRTARVAFDRQLIDIHTYEELDARFSKERERSVILEGLNGGVTRAGEVLSMLGAGCFTLEERARLLAKVALREIGVRTGPLLL